VLNWRKLCWLTLLLFSGLFFYKPACSAADLMSSYIPKNAPLYIPILRQEQTKYFKATPIPNYTAGLIEHENCVSLTSKMCWNPHSKLQTKRELGIGFPQLTKAFYADGRVRFDALSDLVRQHRAELGELSWSNIESRPDLQLRATVIMVKDNYTAFSGVKDITQRFKMADAAHNSGLGAIEKKRRVCGLTKGCNPAYWDDNVEKICLTGKKVLYSGKTACDINRYHVTSVFKRVDKYKPYFK
jgi:hypothetical protein